MSMTQNLFISEIKFKSGLDLKLKNDSIVVLVGPNSSGKTQTLREIKELSRETKISQSNLCLSSMKIKRLVNLEELHKYVGLRAIYDDVGNLKIPEFGERYSSGKIVFTKHTDLTTRWAKGPLEALSELFIYDINLKKRLTTSDTVDKRNSRNELPNNIHQEMEFSTEKEKRPGAILDQIIGKDLVLDRGNGKQLSFHVGERPDPALFDGELSIGYTNAVAKLPKLISMGDGHQAVAGLMAFLFGYPKDVYLVDEPDVFLHPPQAHEAAKLIATNTPNRQMIIATHNSNFLRGLFDGAQSRVIVLRLDRNGDAQNVFRLENDYVAELSDDPLVKYSNVLDAIFFKKVVVCENETDCLFYQTLLQKLDLIEQYSSVFWLGANGKQNIKKIVRILKSFGIEVYSIPDLDLLNNTKLLTDLIEAHEGDYNAISTKVNQVHQHINLRRPNFKKSDVVAEIVSLKDEIDALTGTDDIGSYKKKFVDIFNKANPWNEVKRNGVSAFASGPIYNSLEDILKYLDEIGIILPKVGELEGFYRRVKKGPDWLPTVLNLDFAQDTELSDARVFANRLNKVIFDD